MPYAKEYPAIKVMDGVTFNDVVTEAYSDEVDVQKFKRLTLYTEPSVAGGVGDRYLTVSIEYEPEEGKWFEYSGPVGQDEYSPLVLDAVENLCFHADCTGANMRFRVAATGTTSVKTITLTMWVLLWS